LTRRTAFEKTRKYPEEVKAAIQQLLVDCPLPRDALPYTDQFDRLKTKYEADSKATSTDHEFWQLISKIGKYGGAGGAAGRKTAPRTPTLTTEQQLELQRLFPDGIGHRDNLPYTPEFDQLHLRFMRLTRMKLTRHEFWRATSRVAKLSRKPKPLFDIAPLGGLPKEMVEYLERTNPWWRAQHQPPAERFRRFAFREVLSQLDARITPVVAVRGPRQVGKTTIQLQLVEELLLIRHVNPARILRVQLDDTPSLGAMQNPVEAIVRWYEENVLNESINGVAARGEPVYLFFDELQNLHGWSGQLKALVDHVNARTLVTGSSALRIARGHDNLAGRVSTIELGPLRLSEIAGVRGLGDLPPFHCPDCRQAWSRRDFWHELNAHAKRHARVLKRAFSFFSDLGGYPVCHKPAVTGKVTALASQLVEDVVNKSLDNDPVRVGRGAQLDRRVIREVFRLVCRYAGQAVSTKELGSQITAVLGSGIKHSAVEDSIQFLDDAMLIHRIPPLELLLKKQTNPAKLTLCDHFVRNAWLQETIPISPGGLAQATQAVATNAGHLVESIIGYQLTGIPTLEVAWFPERTNEPEVDFVLTLGLKRLPMEMKYQGGSRSGDRKGIAAFCSKPHYAAEFGLLITREESGDLNGSTVAVPASHLLLAM
jgi:predicted AAA+ superfamily ATPase